MDRNSPFVDRPVQIALFESHLPRLERPPGPPPILLFTGPAGAGKTRLLDYLYARAKEPLTCARVRVDPEGGATSLLDVLNAVQEELASDRHPQCGPIAFPRYELGRWMRDIAPELGPHPDVVEIESHLRALLNRRYRAPRDAGQAAQNILVVLVQWIVELLLPALLTKPSVIRRMLWGRHRETGFVWFERHQRDIDLPENRRFDDVIRRVCALLASSGSEIADESATVDRLLIRAFLDDLRAAYDTDRTRGARLRTTPCAVLVDDIDRLPDGRGFALLELLAEQRASTDDHDPLLFAVTSQRPSASGDAASSRFLRHMALEPFTRDATRSLVTGPGLPDEARSTLAEEVFHATHGHPLAVQLAVQALRDRHPGTPRMALRRMLAEPVPSGVPDALAGDSIERYLLRRFCEPIEGKLDRRRLAACAAPRRLDVPAVRVALGLPDDDTGWSNASEVWDELAGCAFAEPGDPDGPNGRLVLHPLLRDLLARELATRGGAGQLDYAEVHGRFARYFEMRAERHPEAALEHFYHRLALDDVQPVVQWLRGLLDAGHPIWPDATVAVAEAPWPVLPDGGGLSEVRSRIRVLALRRAGALVPLLDSARMLYSPTSDVPWTAHVLDEARAALRAIGEEQAAAELGATVASPPRVALRDDENAPFPCPRRRSYRGARRAGATVTLLLLLIGYLTLYQSYATETCGAAGLEAAPAVLADRFAGDGVYVRHAGARSRGPCIGITDGEFVFDPQTRAVQREIAAENRWVERHHKDVGRPYVTAVVTAPLTPERAGALSAGTTAGRNTLEGVYLAQHRYNRAGYLPMLRVLVANVGSQASYAAPTGRQIVQAARQDGSVVAVLGLAESRDTTLRAVDILSRARLPMVASAAASDRFEDSSDYYFRVGVPNRRQAGIVAAYARQTLDAREAIVIYDRHDPFSQNLATDFSDAFRGGRHRIILPDTFVYNARHADVANELLDLTSRACPFEPDLVYFAGRDDQAAMLLRQLREAQCPSSVALMGGDALGRLEAAPAIGLSGQVDRPVFYTAQASPAVWREGQEPFFYDEYYSYLADTEGVGGPAGDARPPDGRTILAYDATLVLTRALIRLGDRADRFTVWREIGLTTGFRRLPGVGGVVDFGLDADTDTAGKAAVLLRLEAVGEPAALVGTCGVFSPAQATVRPPQDRLPCP
ncbi:MAG: ABC transporter substrate-binding protein [Carbonactinosporaceae bacterium]